MERAATASFWITPSGVRQSPASPQAGALPGRSTRRRRQPHLDSQGMNSRRRREALALARSQEDRRHRDANQRPALSPESRISNRSEASRWAWERLLEARSRPEASDDAPRISAGRSSTI